jgi:hypothetical protein
VVPVDRVITVTGAGNPFRGEATPGGSNGAVTAPASTPNWLAALHMRGWDAGIQEGTMLNRCVSGSQTAVMWQHR